MVEGSVTTTALMALIAGVLTEGVKRWKLDEKYYKFIPIPLVLVTTGIGVGLAAATGNPLIQGGIEGVVAGALAAFGYDAVSGFTKP